MLMSRSADTPHPGYGYQGWLKDRVNRKGNVVDPDALIQRLRCRYRTVVLTLCGTTLKKDLDWNEQGVEGCYRFFKPGLETGS